MRWIAAGIGVLLFLAGGPAAAQISVRYTGLGKAMIRSDDAPADQEARVGMNIVDVEAAFPLRMHREGDKATFLLGRLGFRRQEFVYDWPPGDTEYKPGLVYGASAGLTAILVHGERWMTIGFAEGGAFSDWEDPGSDDLYFEGGVFLSRGFGPHWRLGAGPVFTYAFGDPVFLPAPYVRYQGGGRVLVDVWVPQHAIVGYEVTPRTLVGIAVRPIFRNYNLGAERARTVDGKKTSIVFSDFIVGLESRLQVGGPVGLDLGVGTTFHRKLDINDSDGDELYSRGMDNVWVVTAALTLFGGGEGS